MSANVMGDNQLPIASLRDRVYALMSELPNDKVTTYGDLAALAGEIAHGGPANLPWHRLVNAKGGLAIGFPEGRVAQKQLLAQDGIACDERWHVIEFEERRWRPEL